ncbi:hypothetical protein MYSTI_05482 [Myxococcus stipitatus DSM 14675]|uniref:Lipoprotein n=1 Tax=Myxococcus stipitatus (strain DSM 14675 / JCM 12634 / Mx s8) TaxID=1278073 RepID=L7UFU5_MYXSD|nr:hypothetical protein [Myxococcus stipitatus]AGC46760.1 hypothetical protein MYSTI_05482 [Myxococcus stipitatus DSM 14675]
MPRRRSLMLLGVLWMSCVSTPHISAPAGKPSSQPSGGGVSLPVLFNDNLFIVQPTTREGMTLALFTATGGGLFIQQESATQLGLERTSKDLTGAGATDWVRLPDFQPGAWIPAPEMGEGLLPVAPMPIQEGTFGDGVLGSPWFSGRVWTFDYPGEKLWLRAAGDLPVVEARHRVSLGFRSAYARDAAPQHPRIQVRVDGEVLDLVLDTGSVVWLSESARKALADERTTGRAASVISHSLYERWHQRHPDWRVIEEGDANVPGAVLIEVPRIELAGHEVGPVWFATRHDETFTQYSELFMDKPVAGALGGNALKFFRVTLDYVQAVAVFER